MKRTALVVFLSLLVACPMVSSAGEKNAAKSNDPKAKVVERKKTAKTKKTEQVVLTGSYIKKDIRRNGIVTDGASPVAVLDEEMIRNSGAADLREVLVHRGLNR